MTVSHVKTRESAKMWGKIHLNVHALKTGPAQHVKPKVNIQFPFKLLCSRFELLVNLIYLNSLLPCFK